MSASQSSGPHDSQQESVADATRLQPDVGGAGVTLTEEVSTVAKPGGGHEHTLDEPPELSAATIVHPQSERGTFAESVETNATQSSTGPSAIHPESAVPTLIDAASQEAAGTSPEIQATAGSSSAARAWAPTKGASGTDWPGSPAPSPTAKRPNSQHLSDAPRAEDRYRLIDNFAHGGLGSIWRAEDTAIHREIAFKELLPKALKNRVIVERFLEEAQITGQLEHPGIVPIYDVGYQENGTPFYAMKLVKGSNMEQAIESLHALPRGSTERQLAFTRLLRQFIAVCQAVAFAHEKGVLHRDLKPLNVMLGEFGETLVLDWGLAKLVDVLGEQEIATDSGGQLDNADPNASVDHGTVIESQSSAANTGSTRTSRATRAEATAANAGATNAAATSAGGAQSARTEADTFGRRQVATDARTAGSQTIMGQIMGTPAYMPPEQAQGLIDQLDARTDIYSLGAILYKVLTSLPPVPRGKAQEVLIKVVTGQIPPPREIDPSISPALAAICGKAMALQQADRYATALDLAADVEAWLADEPVSVYPDPWPTRFRRWRKRHRTAVISSMVAVVVFGLAIGGWRFVENRRVESLQLAAQSKVDGARLATEQSDLVKANLLLTEALGQVRAESTLTQLRDRIQSDLDNVARLQAAAERERLAELRVKASRLLDDAKQAAEDAKDFAQARTLLTEAVTLLAKESSLAELHRQTQLRLAEVNQVLAEQSEVAAAQAQLAKFQAAVEQVRVFSGNLSGEDSVDDLREAHRQARAALDLFAFDFDQPEEFDPRLRLLGPDAIERWRRGMWELLFTIAQAETNLAMKDDPKEVRAAAERSLIFVRNAEQLGFDTKPLWLLKADLLHHSNRTDDAQAALAEAERHPAQSRLDHYLLAENARRTRQFKQAIQHLQDALRVEPNDFWSLNLMGICHLNLGQPQAAAAEFTACIAQQPELVWPYVSRGAAFADFQEFDNARRDLAKALELDPQSYSALLNRGFVSLLQKDFAAAQTDFQTCADLRPDLSAPHLNLAEVHRKHADELLMSNAPDSVIRAKAEIQKALAELTSALPLAPQQATIYQLRGEVQFNLVDPAAALADFQKAIKLEPNPRRRAVSWREIGFIHQRAKRFPEALAAFDQSLLENPRDTNVIRERAEVLLSLRQFDEAIAGFTAFLEKAGPVGDVYRARGLAFAETKKYREAINDYTMSLQYEPSPNMLTRRGWAYLLEASKLAKEDFEEAVRLNPEDPDTAQGLAYAMALLGDHAGAVAEIEKAAPITKRAAAQHGPRGWPLFYNPATTYSQAFAKLLVDPKLTNEQRDKLADKYVTRAVELLTEAHQVAGPQFRKRFQQELRGDTAFDPIRQRPEFVEALKTLDPESSAK